MATSLWEYPGMDRDAAERRIREAMADQKAAEAEYRAAIAAAIDTGAMRPAEIADLVGKNYETVRRIAREAGVKRLREPTVTSRKRLEGPASG